jgi:hypothetical protein
MRRIPLRVRVTKMIAHIRERIIIKNSAQNRAGIPPLRERVNRFETTISRKRGARDDLD